jgi:hypothetical protein
MTESEIQVYVDLNTKAQNNDLTEEEFNLYVKLTTTFVLQATERVKNLQQNWEETDELNRLLCSFLDHQELVEEFRDFIEEYEEKATEEQILN